jgi:hypothetical protein
MNKNIVKLRLVFECTSFATSKAFRQFKLEKPILNPQHFHGVEVPDLMFDCVEELEFPHP